MRILVKFYDNRNLLKNLVLRDLKQRYVGSLGGFLWSVIHPIVLLVSYTYVFSIVFGARMGIENGTESFPLFLFCGILPWMLFQDTVIRNCSVITDNASLITKTVIPAEILPVSITLSNLVHHGIGLVILFAALAAFETVPLSAAGVLIYLPILLLFAQGLGWIVSGLQVFLRDTIQAAQILMFLWFWFTPIFYPPGAIPESFRAFVALNPMSVVVTGYRNSLLGLPQPSPLEVAVVAGISLMVFAAGGLVFRQAKPVFADVL